MSNIRVEKCFFDMDSAIDLEGNFTGIEISYLVFEASEENNALQAVREVAEEKIANLKLKKIEIVERINETIFKVRTIYEPEIYETGESGTESQEPVYNFDTGGGTMHRTQSLATLKSFPAGAPDFKGAIEVDNEGNVNGVDITMPLMNFSETHYFSPSKVNTDYKKRIAKLTGTVNAKQFKGYEPGEVLFLGASGSRRGKHSDDYWEISFRFAVSPNVKTMKVGDITVQDKQGWNYLWVRYADDIANDHAALIKKPVAAYVEKVYEQEDFGGLGIGL